MGLASAESRIGAPRPCYACLKRPNSAAPANPTTTPAIASHTDAVIHHQGQSITPASRSTVSTAASTQHAMVSATPI